jgi:hypothetical protein
MTGFRNTVSLTVDTSLRRQIASAVRNSQRFFADITGANDPASRGAARVLMRAIRKQLSRKAGKRGQKPERSQPGEAPRKASGKLSRSVGTEVVGGIRRVGVARFVGRLLEEGVDTTVRVTPNGRAFGKRRRKAGTANRTLRIAPRPFMQKALEEALPYMEGEAVSSLQAKDRTLRTY